MAQPATRVCLCVVHSCALCVPDRIECDGDATARIASTSRYLVALCEIRAHPGTPATGQSKITHFAFANDIPGVRWTGFQESDLKIIFLACMLPMNASCRAFLDGADVSGCSRRSRIKWSTSSNLVFVCVTVVRFTTMLCVVLLVSCHLRVLATPPDCCIQPHSGRTRSSSPRC